MGWIYLGLSIIVEVLWILSLKGTQGYTKLGPSLLNLFLNLSNLWLLAQAFKSLPTATAYTIWTGVSGIGIAICAAMLVGESMSPLKLGCIGMVLVGVIGLKILTPS